MKLFWSWQSDTPGRIGRHFVREALDIAVSQLKEQPHLVEPSEREALSSMQVDQDRQKVAGSTDLAAQIRKKIEDCAVFVADVTSVGIIDPIVTRLDAPPTEGRRRRSRKKRLINSNVAIELGYAYKARSDTFVLLVMNTHFGIHEDLPFDIRHKGATIAFALAPNADAAERSKVQKVLVSRLVGEIRLCLTNYAAYQVAQESFPVASETMRGLYFPKGETLAEGGEPNEQPFQFKANSYAFMRVHPLSGKPPVGRRKITDVFEAGRLMTLSERQYPLVRANRFGPIGFEGAGTTIHALIQGFPTGELWSVNGYAIRQHNIDGRGAVVILACPRFG